MRDEMDARIWNAHHDQLSTSVGELADALAAGLRGTVRLAARIPNQVFGIAVATAMTTLTLSATVA